MKTRQFQPNQTIGARVLASLMGLSFTLMGCSADFSFQEVQTACEPPRSSARYGKNIGPIISSPDANTPFNTNMTVSGTCADGYPIVIKGSGVDSEINMACSSGTFSADVRFKTGDGIKQMDISQPTVQGTDITDRRCFNQDSVPPKVAISGTSGAMAVGQTTIRVDGTCETGLDVIVEGPNLLSPVTTQCLKGHFSTQITFTGSDGLKDVVARQVDRAGNNGQDDQQYLTDTTAPIVTITSPAPQTLTQGTLTLAGTCETGPRVIIQGGILGGVTTADCLGGQYSAPITLSTGDGTKSVMVSQSDVAGNTGMAQRDFVKDATAPVIRITSPAANTVSTGTVALSGTCESGLIVNLSGTGLGAPATTSCSNGTFGANLTLASPDGTKEIVASQTDGAGNTGTDRRSFLLDGTAPVVTIENPAANSVWMTDVPLQGACETGIPVQISGSGVMANFTANCTSNRYSVNVALSTGDGTKNIVVSQTDSAGNRGTANRNFIRDSSAPVVAITSPTQNAYVSANATIRGSCENGIPVVLSGTGLMASINATCAGSSFSQVVTFTIGDGNKDVRATQTDSAGNTATDTKTYVRDSTAPVIRIASPAAGSVYQNSLTLTGTCESGLSVNLSGPGISSATTTTCNTGNFNVTLNLSNGDGPKNIIASQTDAAGNTGSDNRNFVRDSTAPAIAITQPAANTTAATGLTVSGTCESGLPVMISGSGVQTNLTTACSGGTFSVAVVFTAGDGVKNVVATQTDAVGNSASANRDFVRDNAGPAILISAPAANSLVNATATITGTCETGYNVQLGGSGVTSTVTVGCSSNAFSGFVTFTAGDGVKMVTASQTDAAGNTGSDARNFLRDTTAPNIQITQPAAGSVYQNSLTLMGTCEAGLTVSFSGAGIATASTTTCASGTFSMVLNLSNGDGTKNIVASQTDAAGNTGSDNRSFVKDSTAPAIAITAPAVNTVAQTGLTVSGTCEAGLSVTLSGSGVQTNVTTTCPSGAFSAAIVFTAGDGTKNIVATQTDAVGNTASANRDFIRDNLGPNVTITSPAANSYVGTTALISGTCETGYAVQLAGSGVATPTSVTCSATTFSGTVTFTSGDGTKTITASQTDTAGNTGSDSRNFVRDTTAPNIAITSPAANSVYQSSLTLAGTCEAGLTVSFSGAGIATASTTTCASGTFSMVLNLSNGDGTKNIVASQTDAAGNTGSDNRSFVKDSTAPAIAITTPAANTVAQTGLTVGGTCEAGLMVNLSGTGLASATSTACIGGSFSVAITFSPGEGIKNIIASQTDTIGNTASDNRNFVRDNTAPIVTISTPAANTYVTTTATITGTCESGIPVQLAGSGIATMPAMINCLGSTFSGTVTFTSGDGTKTVTASQTDAAGNTGSDSRNFVRDTTAPNIRITSPAANSVYQSSLTLAGTCEAGLLINLSGAVLPSALTTSCNTGNFSVTLNLSNGDGTKNIVASQTDAAGNTGSDNRSFIKDSTAPAIAITAPAVNTVAQAGLTVSGTCEAGLSVTLSGSGVQTNVTTTCPSGAFSAAIVFTAGDGLKNVVATQTDAVGNSGSANRNFVRDSSGPAVAITSPAANSLVATTATISGTCEAGLNVQLAGSGVVSAVTVSCPSATFTGNVTFTAADGVKTVTASQTDAAGNIGSDSRDFLRDATAPIVTILNPAANSVHSTSLTLQGACESGLNVSISGSGAQNVVTTACTASTYSALVNLSAGDGTKNIVASQTDLAGNTGNASRNFIRDGTAPIVTISSPAAGSLVRNTVTLTGTCENGLTVNYSGSGISAPTTSACNSGNYSMTLTFSAGDGTKTFVVSQTDAAGNTGSATRDFLRDSTAPAIAITSPAANTAAASGLTISGTCETGLTVNISGDVNSPTTTTCAGGIFSAAILFSTGTGTKTITASQTDLAGNVGSSSRPFLRSNNSGYDVFTSNGPGGRVDILFVDDNSASMDPEQAALGSRFSAFTSALAGLDWHVGIVTTDCTTGSPHNFCGQLFDMAGQTPGTYFLTPLSPNFLTSFQNTIQRPETRDCLLTGTCPSGREEGLKSAITAMTLRNADNAGFFRNDADLALVFLSDEDEQSNAPATATRPTDVVTEFRNIWGTSKKMSAYGIIVRPGDTPCYNMQRSQLGNNANYGTYQDQLATLTGGMSVSICEPDYSVTLTQIGDDVTRLSKSVDLSQTPIAGSVSVVFTPAYSTTWTVNGNRVTFATPAPAGTRVEIFYQY